MRTQSPLGRPARRDARSPLGLTLAAFAGLWLAAGLVGAAHYVDSYVQYRGFPVPKDPGGVAKGRVMNATFYSAALGRQASYIAYLPAGYDTLALRGRRYPTLYLLHGSPGYPASFLKIAGAGVALDVLMRQGTVAPMVLVMPDGRIGGDTFSQTDWADGSRGRYAAFVLDVVADVDRRLRTVAVRTARVLAGYSEGGFGAVNVGLHNLAVFAGIEAWSGYYVEGRSGTFAKAPQAVLSANSPLVYAASLGSQIAIDPVRVFLYTGVRDPQAPQMTPLVAELRAAGAQARAATYPGAHDWGLWHAHVGQMLGIAARDFALAPTAAARPGRGAARRALLAGLAVANQARSAARRAAVVHDRAVAACRGSVDLIAASAGSELGRLSGRGLAVVHHHLVRDCLVAPAGQPVVTVLCERLASAIAIERRSALRRSPAITNRCLRAQHARSGRTHGGLAGRAHVSVPSRTPGRLRAPGPPAHG